MHSFLERDDMSSVPFLSLVLSVVPRKIPFFFLAVVWRLVPPATIAIYGSRVFFGALFAD